MGVGLPLLCWCVRVRSNWSDCKVDAGPKRMSGRNRSRWATEVRDSLHDVINQTWSLQADTFAFNPEADLKWFPHQRAVGDRPRQIPTPQKVVRTKWLAHQRAPAPYRTYAIH